MNRRRFLAITAAMLATPGLASAATWRGRAFGGDVDITLRGARSAKAALPVIVSDIRRIERKFSLFDPQSELSRLNLSGEIEADADWRALTDEIDRVYELTGGAFDPTVQPLWRLMAATKGAPDRGDLEAARGLIGWDRVSRAGGRLRLAPGQALTLNGIAQGYASDVITARLAAAGFDEVLVNLGEFRAGREGDWRVGLGETGRVARLSGDALAVSEPAALQFGVGGSGHIISGDERGARWRMVAVQAERAALADGLSTGFALMDKGAISAARPAFTRASLIDHAGELTEI